MAKDEFLEEEKDVEEKVEEEKEELAEKEKVEEKVKVGEEEYTQEELDRLVKLGKIGVEAEEKFDTKLDKVWPEFTSKSQELKELKKAAEEREEKETEAKAARGEDLSPEEQRKLAQEEARKLDLVLTPDLEKKIDERYTQLRAAERLREDTDDVVADAQDKYGIKTDTKEVLEHMAETGIRNPEKALKDKFETQIDKWKEVELSKKRGTGLVTEDSSTAGAKEPETPKITRENVGKALSEALRGG